MTATKKTLTFRSDDGLENFQIIINVKVSNGKTIYVEEGSTELLEYLKSLKLVKETVKLHDWLDSFENLNLKFYSGSKNSLKIRKKASILGLTVVPGECFEKRKLDSLKNVKRTVTLLK